jgi:hypothetical protein
MADSRFTNVDHDLVRIRFRTRGEENMKLLKGADDVLKGPDGASYQFCWKTRDEDITNDEFDEYGSSANYGDDFTFGDPDGQAP